MRGIHDGVLRISFDSHFIEIGRDGIDDFVWDVVFRRFDAIVFLLVGFLLSRDGVSLFLGDGVFFLLVIIVVGGARRLADGVFEGGFEGIGVFFRSESGGECLMNRLFVGSVGWFGKKRGA